MSGEDTFPGEAEVLDAAQNLTYVDTGETEEELLAKLPPPGSPVTVVRPVRLPYEIDAMVKALAKARGLTMSDLIREFVTNGLAGAGQTPDPVTELRRGLDTAQRALDSLTGRGVSAENRDAA
jgi:hypothetical protein